MQDMPGAHPLPSSENEDEAGRSPGSLMDRIRRLFGGGREPCQPCEAAEVDAVSATTERKTRVMMGNLFAFSRLRVDDVLVPRADIIAIEASASIRELFELFTTAQHSRLPVYRETLDDMLGMIHIKDLLHLMHARAVPRSGGDDVATEPDLILSGDLLATRVEDSGLMRPVLFAPPSMPAGDLLLKMQSTHLHMAIVIDEYGGTEGIVTIEDLVEEIVGEISDEHDEEEEELIRPAGKGYVVAARADLKDLEALLGLDLLPPDLDEETETVGGLVFALAGRVPARGEIIRHESGMEFEILEADPRRVKKIRVVPPIEA